MLFMFDEQNCNIDRYEKNYTYYNKKLKLGVFEYDEC